MGMFKGYGYCKNCRFCKDYRYSKIAVVIYGKIMKDINNNK